ncbi:DUF3558 domain-containing protein [Corynebacterium lizhenjunii]|uniref:DUF3558 domain-containing protein n=1 Tax=Corynebacterium lizhenjunii TaxID=2709394 RepID=A0A7T0KE08_9CORY|nr:DUF3558 family protein [Corynebacterium lizhenjunii]QPK78862.1 DUF3558 domain-containing protein [Corynebacterium lizhenjunii]
MRADLGFYALALMAAGAFALTGCTSDPVSNSFPDLDEGRESESATVNAYGFAMPAPGPFDRNALGFKPFKPCEDIPDEVFERLGVRIRSESRDSLPPYPCFIDAERLKANGTLELASYQLSLADLTKDGVLQAAAEPGPAVERSVVLTSHEYFDDGYCMAGVETAGGFISIAYASWLNEPSGASMCEVPTQLIQELYGVKNDQH